VSLGAMFLTKGIKFSNKEIQQIISNTEFSNYKKFKLNYLNNQAQLNTQQKIMFDTFINNLICVLNSVILLFLH